MQIGENIEMTVALFLKATFADVPTGVLSKALQNKDIKRAGNRLSAKDIVRTGDILAIYIDDKYLQPKIQIVYQDDDILVVDKPRGILSVGIHSLEEKIQKVFPTAQACHRLDYATCGLLLFSKNKIAHSEVLSAFSKRTIDKTYRCLVKGHLPSSEAILHAYLRKDAGASHVSIHEHPGRDLLPITTGYRVIKEYEDMSLLSVDLLTGRTHQIRAHMQYLGHPILGDDHYGDRAFNRDQHGKLLQLQAVYLQLHFPDGPMHRLDGLKLNANILSTLQEGFF